MVIFIKHLLKIGNLLDKLLNNGSTIFSFFFNLLLHFLFIPSNYYKFKMKIIDISRITYYEIFWGAKCRNDWIIIFYFKIILENFEKYYFFEQLVLKISTLKKILQFMPLFSNKFDKTAPFLQIKKDKKMAN